MEIQKYGRHTHGRDVHTEGIYTRREHTHGGTHAVIYTHGRPYTLVHSHDGTYARRKHTWRDAQREIYA